jgi:hypothetical protein
MPQTFSDGKNIYCVDMMHAFINIFKPKITRLNVSDLVIQLEMSSWGNPLDKNFYSPLDVLDNPEMYSKDMQRINRANLSYPIIIYDGDIVDGLHRLTKAKLINKKTINVYIFSKELMDKFIIDDGGNWNGLKNLKMHDYIQLFYQRFT